MGNDTAGHTDTNGGRMLTSYPRNITSIWGMPKKGKSHLGLTWPKPMKAIEIGETGIEDLLHKFDGVDYQLIASNSLRMGIDDHRKILADFEVALDAAIKEPNLRTLLIDSASKLWESIGVVLTDEAHRESERTKRNQADWTYANNYFEQIIQKVRKNRDLNLVLLHRHREKFARIPDERGNMVLQATGEVESRDYRGIENLAQIIIRCGTVQRVDPRTQRQVESFSHTIEICRFDKSLEGMTLPNMTYDTLMEEVFGKTNPVL